MRNYTGYIDNLLENEIFCFGSNTQGRHGKGTALIALSKFGARYGQPSGIQGRSYGIITTDITKKNRPSVTKEIVISEIKSLYEFALKNPNLDFLVAYTGKNSKNLSGFTNSEFAEMFSQPNIPQNIIFEKEFSTLLNFDKNREVDI